VSVESAWIAQPKLRFARLWWALGWVFVAVIVAGSLEHNTPAFTHGVNDKVLHFAGYFSLALWFGALTRRSRYLLVGVLLLLLGAALELAQGFMGLGRTADWRDLLANSLGILTGLGLSYAGLGMWMVWVERLFGLQK
jgi:VanZ family protein